MSTPVRRSQPRDFSRPSPFESLRLVQPGASRSAFDIEECSSNEPRPSEAFPTIIVASKNLELREWLSRGLSQGIDPLVLEADSESAVLNFVKMHSRPIHVLLIDCALDFQGLVATVARYRRDLRTFLVSWNSGEDAPGALSPEAALAKAEEALAH